MNKFLIHIDNKNDFLKLRELTKDKGFNKGEAWYKTNDDLIFVFKDDEYYNWYYTSDEEDYPDYKYYEFEEFLNRNSDNIIEDFQIY